MSDLESSLAAPWLTRSAPDATAQERHAAELERHARGVLADALAVPVAVQLRAVGICGAGLMGTGIAQAALRAGLHVTVYDAAAEALDRARQTLADSAAPRHVPLQDRLHLAATPESLYGCDLLIESVVENRELKRQVLRQVTARLSATTLVATNTSTIPLAQLADAVACPARFCGLHFCYPVGERRAVEVVPAGDTDPGMVAAALRFVIDVGHVPMLVRDSPGFVINRLLLPYLNEALEMLCDRVDPRAIDRAARAFGMPWGPFETFDMIGLDTAMRAGRTMWEAFPDRIALTPVLPKLVKLGRLGRKVGRGFYLYEDPDSRGVPDPALDPILAPYLRRPALLGESAIVARLVLAMLLEATRVLEEGLVGHPRDIDVASVLGLAFPPARGGLLHWADRVGAARIMAWLSELDPLASRLRPTPLLQSLAAAGQSFYP